MATVGSHEQVRGTQSFVHVLSACWKRPSLTGLEVLWRWVFGIPALTLSWFEATRVLRGVKVDTAALGRMTVFDPAGSAATLAKTAAVVWPPVWHVAVWLAPLLLVAWVVVSTLGRMLVIRRVEPRVHATLGSVMMLQGLRVTALAGVFVAWIAGLGWAAGLAIQRPIAAGQEPNLVLYCGLAILITLAVFMVWAVTSWVLSIAPLLAMLRKLGAGASLASALRLGRMRSKLIEINLVMGIVKIALLVLAMVASACPLPFEGVATPEFMTVWYIVVAILYFVASDLFHVVRQVYYLEMWKTFHGGSALAVKPAPTDVEQPQHS